MPKMMLKPEAPPIHRRRAAAVAELAPLKAALINPRTPADLNRLLIDQRTQQSPHPRRLVSAQRLPAAQQIEPSSSCRRALARLGKSSGDARRTTNCGSGSPALGLPSPRPAEQLDHRAMTPHRGFVVESSR